MEEMTREELQEAWADALDRIAELEEEKETFRIGFVREGCRAAKLTEENQRLKEKLDWLDNNTTHYLTNESEAPVLAGVVEKIWYHATDNVDSYPFSAVIDKALEKQHE